MTAMARASLLGFVEQADLRLLAALPGRGDRRALARQQRLVDPAFRAVRIADAPPVVVFLDDLHRQARLQVEPVDRVVDAGADARIDPARFQADEARQRQAARTDAHVLRRGRLCRRHGSVRRIGRTRISEAAAAARRNVERDTLSPVSWCCAGDARAPPNFLCHRRSRLLERAAGRYRFRVSPVLVKEVSTTRIRGNYGRPQEASGRHHAQAAGPGGNAHARAVRRAAEPRRPADEPAPSWWRRSRRPTCWCRPSPTASTPR